MDSVELLSEANSSEKNTLVVPDLELNRTQQTIILVLAFCFGIGAFVQLVGVPIVLIFQGARELYNKLNILVFVSSLFLVTLQLTTVLGAGKAGEIRKKVKLLSDRDRAALCMFSSILAIALGFPYTKFVPNSHVVDCNKWQTVLSTFGTVGYIYTSLVTVCTRRSQHYLILMKLRNKCLDEIDISKGALVIKHVQRDIVRDQLMNQFNLLLSLKLDSERSLIPGSIEFLLSVIVIAALLFRDEQYNLITINLTTVSCVPFVVNMITCFMVNRELEKVEFELQLKSNLEIRLFGLYKVNYFTGIGVFISIVSFALKVFV